MKFPGLLSFSVLFLLIGMMSLFLPAFAASIDSPLKQVEMGVEPEDVTCKDSFQLLIRYSGEPACVKPKSADRLVDAGWGTVIQSMKMMGSDHKDRDVMSTQDTDTKQEQTMKMTHKPMMVGGIDVAMSPTLEGDQNAPITIIEFGDFRYPKFNQCLDSDMHEDRIMHNKQVGISNDVEGTPAFFVVSPDVMVKRIDGPQPAAVFLDIIG